MKLQITTIFLSVLITATLGQWDPHFIEDRQGIVHLFEWKWLDIADECETFLGPNNFGGVQTSVANENVIISGRPWYERYQPMSYKLETRSGNEEEFREMVLRCRNVGVRIYVDVVINHMAAPQPESPAKGTGGSEANPSDRLYPAVPYNKSDFNAPCSIENYNDANQVRNCELAGLPDLDQGRKDVRMKIAEFLNHLIDLGVAGYRVDASKHMWPKDLRVIYSKVKPLSKQNGFTQGSRPFFFQEVIDLGNEAIKRQEYISLGTVTEFTYSNQIGMVFRKSERNLSALKKWGPPSGFLPSRFSFVFVCNHDNERGHGSGGDMILTYKDKVLFTMASAFMLAHPHGGNHPRLMSSFSFDDPSQGPPQDSDGNIISRGIDSDGACTNGWVCEHRWPEIVKMVKFRAVTDKTVVMSFTNIAENQISFCRGRKGFVAINNSDQTLNATVSACLPNGVYCDVISGDKVDDKCTGTSVNVRAGKAHIEIPSSTFGFLAIHLESKLSK